MDICFFVYWVLMQIAVLAIVIYALRAYWKELIAFHDDVLDLYDELYELIAFDERRPAHAREEDYDNIIEPF